MELPRSSGVLLHISSLYTPHGIGDFGPSAYAFADLLEGIGIHFWQTLPLNYTDAGRGYSPYSCLSAIAGNPLYISLDGLVKDKLLNASDLIPPSFEENIVEFHKVHPYKVRLFDKAFITFQNQDHTAYELFCTNNKHWLDDFTLFLALKKHYNNSWWLDWPKEIKERNSHALHEITKELAVEIDREKFLQYIFYRQLDTLRAYCKTKNVQFIGDMPFYVSHDSCDVWMNPQYFKLNVNKRPSKVCGVPPDMFSDTGQLWGMPVFRWSELKKNNYAWWVERIRQAFNTCDVVRLDHFRAFSAFWEVDASEPTAQYGKWIKGPGRDFFKSLQKHFNGLPFIAEDLGEIDQPVCDLMDEFQLPGMKILQFAFTENTPLSIHSPHHHVPFGTAYTGTHDNNTVRGWYDNEVSEEKKEVISQYFNKTVTSDSCSSDFIRMAISSVADVAIWPMQDMLGLGQEAIMNRPGTMQGNWQWRLNSNAPLDALTYKDISQQLAMYDRLVPKVD